MSEGNLRKMSQEQFISAICAKMLRRPVGKLRMGKSFVAHGGDSLLAIQLAARCNEEGFILSIHDILEATSIRQLCEAAQVCGSESEPESNIDPVTENDTAGSSDSDDQQLDSGILERIQADYTGQQIQEFFPCTSMQETFLIAQALDPHLYQCSWVVRIEAIDGDLDKMDLDKAWEQLVRDHAALRTVFVDSPSRPGHFDQAVLTPGKSEIESVHEDLAQRQFIPVRNGQTHRVLLHQDSPSSAVLRLEMLHTITDGQSGHILLRNLCQAYRNTANSSTSLPSYREFVAHTQQSPANKPSREGSQYLAGAESSFFPTIAGAPNHHHGFATVRRAIEADTLAEYCSKHNVTVANVCQVAWALVLRAYTGSDDVCFSYVLSGRQVPLRGIQNMVGAFVNAVVCRIKVPGEMAVEDSVIRAKGVFLQSLQSQQDATSELQSKEFSRLKGNSLMSCQRATEEQPAGSKLKYEILDATNPTEVSFRCEWFKKFKC